MAGQQQQQQLGVHSSSAAGGTTTAAAELFTALELSILASTVQDSGISISTANISRIGASRGSNSSAAWVEDKRTSVNAPSANGGCGRPCWSLWWCTSAAVPYLPSAAAPTRSPHGRRGAADGERWPAGTLLNLSIGWCPCPRLCGFGPVW